LIQLGIFSLVHIPAMGKTEIMPRIKGIVGHAALKKENSPAVYAIKLSEQPLGGHDDPPPKHYHCTVSNFLALAPLAGPNLLSQRSCRFLP
jgi:hypothetical protein